MHPAPRLKTPFARSARSPVAHHPDTAAGAGGVNNKTFTYTQEQPQWQINTRPIF